MTKEFKEQGGAATMDPSALVRWLTSKVMSAMARPERVAKLRAKAEKNRLRSNKPHRVEYFHQVEDGYSHLSAQVLQKFSERYDIELVCHLVGGPTGKNSPEPEMLLKLSRYDSFMSAPHYGLEFPSHEGEIDTALREQALQVLADQDSTNFVNCACEVGRALWADDASALANLAEQYGSASLEKVNQKLLQGNARRSELKHYSGAMFYYQGEWYWGVDRLYHLEKRLSELGADKHASQAMLLPRPEIEFGPLKGNGNLTLEIYPSLRSPYTAVIFDTTVRLAKEVGVKLKVLPVLPMVMRGVPATREKGMYIFNDAAREAHVLGVPYGPCYDPIGEPVRRAYSLFAWAEEQGLSTEFFSSFLRAAWSEKINTNNDKGMKKVVERVGLNWDDAKKIIGKDGWQQRFEDNRLNMYNMGLWGVPSFRLLNEQGESLLNIWGQDRLWLVSRVIQENLKSKT